MNESCDQDLFCADQGLRRPGFALLRYSRQTGTATVIRKSHVDNKNAKKSHGQMLSEIWGEQRSYLDNGAEYEKVIFVREQGFSKFVRETIALSKVVGIADLHAWTLCKRQFVEIAPQAVKKLVTGSASAGKEEVAIALKQYVGEQEYACDDESDAVAVGVAWLIQNKQVENKIAGAE